MSESTFPRPPFLEAFLAENGPALMRLAAGFLDLKQAPHQRRDKLRQKLREQLALRRIALASLRASGQPGIGSLPASMIEGELGRLGLAEGQLEHLDEAGLLFTLGVFSCDGRPGDYVIFGLTVPATGLTPPGDTPKN